MATLGTLPVFLLSAQSILMGRDLGFGERGLGLAAGVFFTAAAVTSVVVGVLADWIGRGPAMVVSGILAAAGTFGIAIAAHSYGTLLVFIALAGAANAAMQISANVSLASLIPRSRQGLAFGVKQSAVPASILIGGLAVPTVGVLAGWRWTYAAAAVAASLVIVAGLRNLSQPLARARQISVGEHAPRGCTASDWSRHDTSERFHHLTRGLPANLGLPVRGLRPAQPGSCWPPVVRCASVHACCQGSRPTDGTDGICRS